MRRLAGAEGGLARLVAELPQSRVRECYRARATGLLLERGPRGDEVERGAGSRKASARKPTSF